MTLQVGDTIKNKYAIEQLLGEGSFGRIYRATDTRLGRQVAIKELRMQFASDPEMLRRFKNEAISISKLNNPYIVTLYEWIEENNHYYLILEYMDGGNLSNLLKQRNRLSSSEASVIAQAICNGLADVHRQGIYHRDIKPANILLDQDGGKIKISDFGTAHVPALLNGGRLTQTGEMIGTPWYMSPEQARGEKIDQRSDLYALGAILYEMVAGHPYLNFKNELFGDLEKIEQETMLPLPDDVAGDLRRVIAKSLEKNPDKRFQSADDMAMAVKECIGSKTTISMPRAPVAPPAPPSKTTFPWVIIGIVFALVAIISVTLFVLRPQPTPQIAAIIPSSTLTTTPIASTTAPVATEDIRTAVAALIEATRSTQATLDARVAATLTAAVPTKTPTVTPSITPTFTPTPTRTATLSPTVTRVPALRMTNVRFDPPTPYTGDAITFLITFDNTLPMQQLRWRIHIIQADVDQINWDKIFYRTDPQISNIQPGIIELRSTPPWRIATGAGARKFFFRIVEVDEGGRILRIFKTDGGQEDWVLNLSPKP